MARYPLQIHIQHCLQETGVLAINLKFLFNYCHSKVSLHLGSEKHIYVMFSGSAALIHYPCTQPPVRHFPSFSTPAYLPPFQDVFISGPLVYALSHLHDIKTKLFIIFQLCYCSSSYIIYYWFHVCNQLFHISACFFLF